MDHRIVVDSCCDVTEDMRREYGMVSIPLTLTLGEESFTDDENLDLTDFMTRMKRCTAKIGSAAPAPQLYRDAFEGFRAYAVTLSSNLSASYASAIIGRDLAGKDETKAHIFDSKSASAGEALIALRIGRLLKEGLEHSRLVETIDRYIAGMKTYFVLENIDNLRKNGRLGRVTGRIISVLCVKPIFCADDDGNIAFYSPARGERQILQRMADTVDKSGKETDGESMVIAHCNNLPLAERLRDMIAARYRFREIFVVPTRGVSTVYADDKGIVMAF